MKDHTEAAINVRLEKTLSGVDNSGSNSTYNQGLETSFPKQGDMKLKILKMNHQLEMQPILLKIMMISLGFILGTVCNIFRC